MKTILFVLSLLVISSHCYADINNPLTIQEEDGSPTGQPYAIKFSNGTVTDNGDGTFSVTNTGGSGSPGGSTTQVQFNDAGSFAGDVSLSWEKNGNTLGISRDAGQTGYAFVISSDATGQPLFNVSHDGSLAWTGLATNAGTGSSNGINLGSDITIYRQSNGNNARQVTSTAGGNFFISAFLLNNQDTNSNAGVGMLFSAGDDDDYIGGVGSQRTDAASNSITGLRVLSNSSLTTASDTNAPFYLQGTTDGVEGFFTGTKFEMKNGLLWDKRTNTLSISRDSGQTGYALIISDENAAVLANISHDGASFFTTVDTGQGANELYDMNQNVQTTDSPTFAGLTLSSPLTAANGGSGAATHTDGGLLIGKGTGAFENTGVLAKGTIVVGDGTTNPTTFTAGANGTFISYDSSTASGLTTASISSYDRSVVVEMTDAATITPNLDLGKFFRVTLGGSRTLGTPINGTHGQSYIFIISQDATGSRTLSYSDFYRFGTDVTSPTLSTTAGTQDYIGAVYQTRNGKVSMDVVAISKGYAD